MGRTSAVCTMGGAIIRRFALFPLMLLMLLLLPAGMVAQTEASSSKYIATYESSTQTLTFKKFVGETLPENSAWVEDRQTVADINNNLGNGTIKHIVFDKSFSTYTPTSLSRFFENLTTLETITGMEYLNTEKVTNMSGMFQRCLSLTSLDVTHFNTAKVMDMRYMFYGCSKLTSLDVAKFNTEKVTNMSYMFYNCAAYSIDLTSFNTANVTDMSYMFASCSSLTSLDVTHFNTEMVTTMEGMFCECIALTSLDVTNFNTANVTDMSSMFKYCVAYSLDLTSFNTANVTDMSSMFYNCAAYSIDLTSFNTANVTDMSSMFEHCRLLKSIFVSDKFVTNQITNGDNMFNDCTNLRGYNDSKNDHNYANCSKTGYFDPGFGYAMFDYATETLTFSYKGGKPEGAYALNEGRVMPEWYSRNDKIKKVIFDASFANARPTSCFSWFRECLNLTHIEGMENLNTEMVTTMEGMFCMCKALSSLDVTNFNTANVTDMYLMFNSCTKLTSLNLYNFNTENVTNMLAMFSSCNNLATIYTSEKFVTTKVENLNSIMFNGDENLKGALPVYDVTKRSCEYANYKTGYFTKLVGKNGDEKIGATGETLATDNLVLADDKDFVAYEPFAAKAASYSRTVEGTTWATLCLPFEVSLDGQNFRAFKLLSADDVTEAVELEEIEGSIAAGTPVIIKMKDGATELKFTEADKEIAKDVQTAETADANYKLQGIYTKKEFSKDTDNNCYIVKGAKLMNPAKLLDKTTTESVGSKPFRAYMVDNSSAPAAGARMFSISVGGSTTAIEQLETTADSKAEYYDLQGRRLQNLQKGVNIVKRGGKTMKVIIK